MAAVTYEQKLLWLVTIVTGVLTVARLYRLDLHRVYRFFWLYLALRTVRSAFMYFVLIDRRSAYAWVWVTTQPVVWILYVLIVLELYSLVFRDYPGIYTLSRWVLAAGLILAVALSAASFFLTSTAALDRFPVIRYYTMIERGVDSSLVVLLLVLVAFLAWYPVPLRRNALAHSIVYCVFFTSSAAVLLLRNVVGPQVYAAVNTGVLAVSSVCAVLWLFLFSRQGETRKASLRALIHPGDEVRAMAQLNALNRTLIRTARR